MTTPVTGLSPGPGNRFDELTGGWRVDPARSHASFTARAFGRTVRGRLPLTGDVHIAERIEDSAALLSARARALSTGSSALDRLITGPGLLDAGTFPEISFSSELLVHVPTGWRALGWLRVKAVEHELACRLDIGAWDQRPDGLSGMTVTSHWVLESSWVTGQRIPALSRRIAMACSVTLEPGTPAAFVG